MGKRIDPTDIVGNRYGKVRITHYLGYRECRPGSNRKNHFYLCLCDCGKTAEASRSQILCGKRKSCGDCTKIVREADHYRYYDIHGNSFIFDGKDLDIVKSRRWMVNENGYVVNKNEYRGKMVRLARLLMKPDAKQCVDHIDGDRSNNRRENLRIGTNSENHGNQALSRRNTSGYKGVNFRPDTKSYRAYINKDGQRTELGTFDTPEEAARAYDKAARYFFGEFACVNFPMPGEQCCLRNQSKQTIGTEK